MGQRISKPGTSQTDRNVINEKFKEERIQHETFTYIVIDVNSIALYSCQRKEIAFFSDFLAQFLHRSVSTYPSQIERLDFYVLLLHLFAHIESTIVTNCNILVTQCRTFYIPVFKWRHHAR